MNNNKESTTRSYFLKPGFIFVSKKPVKITTILGSCVSVCFYDTIMEFGGMNHFLLPYNKKNDPTAKYGNISIYKLYTTFIEYGSNTKNISAMLLGGAHLTKSELSLEIANNNINISRNILKKLNIKIIKQDTGGSVGRKIVFDTQTNNLIINKIDKLDLSNCIKHHDNIESGCMGNI